jgi:hypothetical protein
MREVSKRNTSRLEPRPASPRVPNAMYRVGLPRRGSSRCLPKEKARRVVVHDPTGFSSSPRLRAGRPRSLGGIHVSLTTGDLPAEAAPSPRLWSVGDSAKAGQPARRSARLSGPTLRAPVGGAKGFPTGSGSCYACRPRLEPTLRIRRAVKRRLHPAGWAPCSWNLHRS